ncbi:MAG: hypothetical protein C0501_09990 [Isosphaera sp.]|nr:hypothetical protein [Isosphaera sp.]
MSRIGMAFALGVLAGVVGCGSSSPTGGGPKGNPLVGTWEGSDPGLKGITLVFTFAADGKYTQETVIEGLPKDPNVKIDGGKQEGTYKQDDKSLTLSAQGKEKKLTLKELTAAKMVLAGPDGKDEMTFKKK